MSWGNEGAEGARGAEIRVFSLVRRVDSGRAGKRKARSQEGFSGQMIAASRRRRAETVVVGEVRQVLVGLRNGETGGREGLWDGGNGGSRGLTDGVPRGLGSGSPRGARMAVEEVP
ncbi:hypothetical protein D2E27_19805 [Mycobacteroides abscessus]|nr:hypothetical protein D2E27_19805 [Mycobacteroides abscessus]